MRLDLGAAIVVVVALQLWSERGRAGDDVSTAPPTAEDQASDPVPSPDSSVSREDWKRRIDAARKRAEQARRDWQLNAPFRTFEPDPPEKIATQRVLGDDTLQPGDIVSTDKGLLQFRGWSGEDGRTAQFSPVAHTDRVGRR